MDDLSRHAYCMEILSKIPWSFVLDFTATPHKTSNSAYSRMMSYVNRNERCDAMEVVDQFHDNQAFDSKQWIRCWSKKHTELGDDLAGYLTDLSSFIRKRSGSRKCITLFLADKNYLTNAYKGNDMPTCDSVVSHMTSTLFVSMRTNASSRLLFVGDISWNGIYQSKQGQVMLPTTLFRFCCHLVDVLPREAENSQIFLGDSTFIAAGSTLKSNLKSAGFELLFANMGAESPEAEQRTHKKSFLQGEADISWISLCSNHDMKRDIYTPLREKTMGLLKHSSTGSQRVILVEHYPGTGATTLARRLAYDIMSHYPVVIDMQDSDAASKYASMSERYKTLHIVSSRAPTLVIVDNCRESDIACLKGIARNDRQLVFAIVKRVFSVSSTRDDELCVVRQVPQQLSPRIY